MRSLKHCLICCIAVFLSNVTVSKADPNLVGWWKLDEESGLFAADSSGQGNHGQLNRMIGNEWPHWIDHRAREVFINFIFLV
jgi:hypothetical protein